MATVAVSQSIWQHIRHTACSSDVQTVGVPAACVWAQFVHRALSYRHPLNAKTQIPSLALVMRAVPPTHEQHPGLGVHPGPSTSAALQQHTRSDATAVPGASADHADFVSFAPQEQFTELQATMDRVLIASTTPIRSSTPQASNQGGLRCRTVPCCGLHESWLVVCARIKLWHAAQMLCWNAKGADRCFYLGFQKFGNSNMLELRSIDASRKQAHFPTRN